MKADPSISSDPHLHLLLETAIRDAFCKKKTCRDVYYQTEMIILQI